MERARRRRGWFWLLTFALVWSAGVSGAAAGNHAAASATATLRVSITGLPPASVASVAVTGPHGFALRLTKTATRKGLRPGWYKIAAAKVKAGSNMYAPTVILKNLHLVGGKSFPVSIKYERLLPPVAPKLSTPSSGGVSPGAGGVGPKPLTPSSGRVSPGAGGVGPKPSTPGSGGVSPGAGGGSTSVSPTAPGGSGGPGLGGGGGAATGTVPAVNFFLAYADTFRPIGKGLPSPWAGSSGATFVGCGTSDISDPGAHKCATDAKGKNEYDTGAIRLDNKTSASLTITNASVQIGTCTYSPWPGLSATIQPGKTLILTQTGGKSPCGTVGGPFNFDSSESNLRNTCSNDNLIPVITLSINGTPTTVTDTQQILNTGGSDSAVCFGGENEAQDWVAVP